MRILFYPWFGSKSKHWKKYDLTYKYIFGKETKVDFVNYSIKDGISYNKWKEIRNGMLDKQIADEYDCLHMVSGGCLIAYNQLNYSKKLKIQKTIFDSSPFYPCSHLTSNYIYHQIPIFPKKGILPLSNSIYKYWTKVEGYTDEELFLYNEWLFNKNKSLCLINPNDPLLDLKTIQLFIKNSESTLVNFKTPHARLLKDKEKYVEAIKKYINKY